MADELEKLKARRVTALYRLDLIGKGAQLTYEDGTPVVDAAGSLVGIVTPADFLRATYPIRVIDANTGRKAV